MAAISSLTTISKATLSANSGIFATPEQAFSLAVINAVNTLNSVMADLENHHASASQPTDQPAGQTWYDSTNTLWKGYKTLNATSPQTFWETGAAYLRNAQTAGTATFKAGGAIDVNTTQVSGGAISYAAPANTISNAGAFIQAIGFGTRINGATTVGFLTTNVSQLITADIGTAGATDWFVKGIYCQPAVGTSGTFKMFAFIKIGNDTSAIADHVGILTGSQDSGVATTFKVGSNNVGENMTAEIMTTRLVP